jgi:hypothetical protein
MKYSDETLSFFSKEKDKITFGKNKVFSQMKPKDGFI